MLTWLLCKGWLLVTENTKEEDCGAQAVVTGRTVRRLLIHGQGEPSVPGQELVLGKVMLRKVLPLWLH